MEFTNKFIIKDWNNAYKMVNYKDINLAVATQVNYSIDGIITGYEITVYNKATNLIITKVFVDQIANWSLSTDECITMLNMLGFNCEFDTSKYIMNETVRKTLTNLKDLGYKYIIRCINPSKVLIFKNEDATAKYLQCRKLKVPYKFEEHLNRITDYYYNDYRFLEINMFYNIEELLTNSETVQN